MGGAASRVKARRTARARWGIEMCEVHGRERGNTHQRLLVLFSGRSKNGNLFFHSRAELAAKLLQLMDGTTHDGDGGVAALRNARSQTDTHTPPVPSGASLAPAARFVHEYAVLRTVKRCKEQGRQHKAAPGERQASCDSCRCTVNHNGRDCSPQPASARTMGFSASSSVDRSASSTLALMLHQRGGQRCSNDNEAVSGQRETGTL